MNRGTRFQIGSIANDLEAKEYNQGGMFTPYDWQEGVGNRAQYIEAKLAQGSPAIAISIDAGIVAFSFRRQAHKIYEVYDRLIFAALGQQSDVESLRVAAVEFAHQEGYNRSEQDVNIQRVATALSAPLKRAFSDFNSSPLVARAMFGEVGLTPDTDIYYVLDFDGDYQVSKRFAVVAGSDALTAAISSKLEDFPTKTTPEAAIGKLEKIWTAAVAEAAERTAEEVTEGLTVEAALLERSEARENRYRTMAESD